MAAVEPKLPYAMGYPAPSTANPYPAYPYPPPPYYGTAPPPQQPYNNNNDDNYGSSSSTFASLRRFFIITAIVFVSMCVLAFVFRLAPSPQVPSFSVSSASISSFNLSSSSSLLSSNFVLILSVHNPDKNMTVYYESIDAAVFLGSGLASETSLTPFSQDKDSSTVIVASLSSVSRYLDAGTVDAVLGTRRSEGAVHLNLRLFSLVRFKDGTWTIRNSLRVHCDDLKIAFANATATSGSLVGSPRNCTVR